MGNRETMVKINYKYVVTMDSMNYTLQVVTTNKKGNENMRIIGHYPSMEKAIVSCRNEMAKDELFKSDSWTMDDALAVIVRCTNHLQAIVKSNFKGVAT